MSNKLWSLALAGIKRNLLPGLVLQLLALALVLSYYFSPVVHQFLGRIAALKSGGGYIFSLISTGLFGGLIPFLYLAVSKQVRRNEFLPQFLFYTLFWAYKGAEVDAFYRLQAFVFGDTVCYGVILKKMCVDQFLYGPLWAAVSQTVTYLWKDSGFSLQALRPKLNRELFTCIIPSVQFSSWVVWIPAVSIIYCLPQPLQIPLFNIVLCFWVLLLGFVTRGKSGAEQAAPVQPQSVPATPATPATPAKLLTRN